MTWRKRRKNRPLQSRPQSPAPITVSTPPEIPPGLKSLMQEAADRAKTELTMTGRITPKALFVYDESSSGETESKIVSVTLSVRSEQQREAMRKRVREKAAAEGAQAVVILHDITEKHLSISGLIAETRITAFINYVFGAEKKTVERWEVEWPPPENDT